MLDKVAQFFADWGVLAISVIIVILLILGISLLIKMWPVLSQIVLIGNALLKLPDTTDKVDTFGEKIDLFGEKINSFGESIESIQHEVMTNTGSSLKDEVKSQGVMLQSLAKTSAQHTKKMASNTGKLSSIQDTVTRIADKVGVA